MMLEFSRQFFEKMFKYQISWKYFQWEPSCSEAYSRLSQFCERAQELFALTAALVLCCLYVTLLSYSKHNGMYSNRTATCFGQTCGRLQGYKIHRLDTLKVQNEITKASEVIQLCNYNRMSQKFQNYINIGFYGSNVLGGTRRRVQSVIHQPRESVVV
jgi:hypothetical protein